MAPLMHTLSFLRPLSLPRSSTITCFLQAQRSLTDVAKPIPIIRPAEPPLSAPIEPIQEILTSKNLPTTDLTYNVLRTGTKGLPVYLDKKRGGNLLLTRIRKVEGDREALVRDLSVALDLESELLSLNKKRAKYLKKGQRIEEAAVKLIWTNPVTGHIVIRGHRKTEVEKFLTERSF